MTGVPKLRIEECSAKQQAHIDSARQVIVGVNKYVDVESAARPLNIREIDNKNVLENQKKRIEDIMARRDEKTVALTLEALEHAARDEEMKDSKGGARHNLLELSVEAARARATVGEITYALEKVWGRYEATGAVSVGTYKAAISSGNAADHEFRRVLEATAAFEREHGRRPRILVAKMGMDGHDRGARVMATGLADVGFDVDLSPLFMTPKEVAQQAIDADVHLVSDGLGNKGKIKCYFSWDWMAEWVDWRSRYHVFAMSDMKGIPLQPERQRCDLLESLSCGVIHTILFQCTFVL